MSETSRKPFILSSGGSLTDGELIQDEGPLELTRRTKVLVWDDEVPMTEDMLRSAEAATGSGFL